MLEGDVFQECCVRETAINRDLTHESFPLDADGCAAVPTSPGLGVTLNDETVERYRVDQRRPGAPVGPASAIGAGELVP